MLERLQEIDSQALLFFNSGHTPLLDTIMMTATGRFVWIPFYVFLLWWLWRKKGLKSAVVWLLATALVVTLADQICGSILRPIFHRLRPANLENPLSEYVTVVNGYRGGKYGFPSCHAANTFAVATLLSLVFRRGWMTMVLFFWALLNCYTRMYLGVHYPGDILAGALVGSLIGVGVYYGVIFSLRASERRPRGDDDAQGRGFEPRESRENRQP